MSTNKKYGYLNPSSWSDTVIWGTPDGGEAEITFVDSSPSYHKKPHITGIKFIGEVTEYRRPGRPSKLVFKKI